ncbi:sec-independent protein translocase protein TatB [Dyella jiangningensis]|uniref:Sec-independent protein translocase protein TatB n=1 Tax=Dyella sp. AtDHG13 TaxID=1938897 RepID=UPI00088C41F5|nr:Sec-independent protein translocase protein TatB [Dyella sp. AtDHG13]PXV59128.1 sec-independent protein translocase protein TatB [Dyella sp. AtDHG13]SDK23127.1 sec-independent protein translocase protein TatB [Dyella jiangningensis]
MIEISFGKLVLLALIALIVLGPEKLPHAARTAGVFMRRIRTGWDSVRAEVERELQVEEIRRQAKEAAARAEAAQADLDETLRKMRPSGVPSSPAPPAAEPSPETAVATDATPTKDVPHGGA